MTLRSDVPSNTEAKCTPFQGAAILVVGLGRFGGGVGVTRWLAGQGAKVTVTDAAPAESLAESISEISHLGVELRLGGHDGVKPHDYDLVVINPAVRKDQSALFGDVVAAGIPWTTELNLFCERCPAFVIGVTGSYGKSTTCAMLAHVLEATWGPAKSEGSRVHLGGNIGGSLLNDLPSIAADDVVVLEISNAQLEDLPRIGWTPHVAVITNLSPHHLDRYGSYEGYLSAKMNIIDPANGDQKVIVGELDAKAERAVRDRVRVGPSRIVQTRSPDEPIALDVPGPHNRRNAACVLTVCQALDLPEGRVREALRGFRGLPHRLELVATINGVRYINDSKSTAPAATITAVRALLENEPDSARLPYSGAGSLWNEGTPGQSDVDRRLIVLIGGQDKHVSFEECATFLAERAKLVIGLGEAGSVFAEAVRRAADGSLSPQDARSAGQSATSSVEVKPGSQDIAAVRSFADLPQAVQCAFENSAPGDTVLFSPGAPSFDHYVNFAARGQRFCELVANSKGCDQCAAPS